MYQSLAANLPLSVQAMAVWREYDARAAGEGVIKELDVGYGLPQLACATFGRRRQCCPSGCWRTT